MKRLAFYLFCFVSFATSFSVSALSITRRSAPPANTNTAATTTASVAPVCITIGPPCCGKTEALRSHLLSIGYNPDSVFSRDVALDETSSAYHRIPLAAFLFPSSHLNSTVASQLLQSSGSTVQDRLLDPSYDLTDQELRNVILRIAGRITAAEFAERTREQTLQAGDTTKFYKRRRRLVANDLIEAVEQVAVQAVGEVICGMQIAQQQQHDHHDELPYEESDESSNSTTTQDATERTMMDFNATQAHLLSARQLIKTPHVDLFVPQAIFNGGIDSANDALQRLLESSPEQPVSWGNTNTSPTEYAAALQAAQVAGRPVKFIAWGTSLLPRVSRTELLRRNVARFRTMGRYIPAGAVGAALGRVESLLKEAKKQASELFEDEEEVPSDTNMSLEEWQGYKIDAGLADLAGFRMDKEGLVVQVGEPKEVRFKTFRGKRNANKLGSNDRRKPSGSVIAEKWPRR